MKKHIISILFLLQLFSCGRNNNLKEVSNKFCDCFENYDENDSETMLNAITKLDSVKKEYNLEAIPKETLINQLQKDCPKAVLVIEELTD